MAQHFLLSAKARSLSLTAICRMSDQEAREAFKAIRWSDNAGEPYCPKCGCLAIYSYAARPIFKCKGCNHQFSVTSGTIFASRKLAVRDYLAAIAIFVNAVKGISALQLGRDLDVSYKTAFVLAHKLREAMQAEQDGLTLSGNVEIDGAYFGGHKRPENKGRAGKTASNKTERRVVVVMRERNGRTLSFVTNKESEAFPLARKHIAPGSTIHADEAAGWDALTAFYEMKRINHKEAYSRNGACTNQAESFFSRLRRAEWGQHHKISAKYLDRYASEMAWREDRRREANGVLHELAARAALKHPVSRDWKGYWQRHIPISVT